MVSTRAKEARSGSSSQSQGAEVVTRTKEARSGSSSESQGAVVSTHAKEARSGSSSKSQGAEVVTRTKEARSGSSSKPQGAVISTCTEEARSGSSSECIVQLDSRNRYITFMLPTVGSRARSTPGEPGTDSPGGGADKDVKELEGMVVIESEMCLFHRDGMCAITGSPSLVPMQAFHVHSDQHKFEGESWGIDA